MGPAQAPSAVEVNSPEILGNLAYVRQRLAPEIRDSFYLCLSDLRDFVDKHAPRFEGAVIDYGCGGSPYKSLFSKATRYTRADMLAGPGVDLVLTADGKIDEPSRSYQGVVSFQVLEHVPDPSTYLDECHRVLSEGGLLMLTTHGLFLEHKCPDDFYRWTSQGLETLLAAQGFEILDSVKITTGLRGLFQLQHHVMEDVGKQGLFLKAVRKAYRLVCVPLLNLAGKLFLRENSIVPSGQPENMYVIVGAIARRKA